MAEQLEVSLPDEEPRHCPACGCRVAARAKTCLMCGVSLVQEQEAAPEEPSRQGLPGWARALIVAGLALAILSAGSFGLYTLMNAKTEQTTPTPTRLPTRSPTSTPTATPTQTPTPTATPTPVPPLAHQVVEGETLIDIAAEYDTTVDTIVALNPGVQPELIQVGQILLIPVPTPTPGPTSTPEPGVPTPTPPDYIVHVVMPGDTLGSIAEKYEVSITLIRTANDLPPDDDTIRVNQSLVIPIGTPVPSPTPTTDPNVTPTPLPPYPAPALLSPPDGAALVGNDTPILLQWASVSVLHDDEWYELNLSQPAGGVVSATVRTRVTSWRVPLDLMPAPDARVREFRWQVQVMREVRDRQGEVSYREAGAPSPVRTFTWLVPTPTPSTPTPTP